MKKKRLIATGLCLTLMLGMVGCGASSKKSEKKKESKKSENEIALKVKNDLGQNAIEFEDVTSVNDEDLFAAGEEHSDGWYWRDVFLEMLEGKANTSDERAFGCTGVIKEIDGKMYISRNMDYVINNKNEVVYKVDASDRYKSINVSNTSSCKESKTYEEVKKAGGINELEKNLMLGFATDGVNEKGLVLELNMRPTEYEEDQITPKFLSDGTNPGKTRAPISMLTRLALDKCASVDELLKMIGAVNGKTGEKYGDGEYDFYTVLNPGCKWLLTFAITDESGRHGVLEPIDNKLVWTEDSKGQANFFVDEATEKQSQYGSGYGRWAKVLEEYDKIDTPEKFYELTKELTYEQVETNEAKWDASTEATHIDVFGTVEKLSKFAEENDIKVPDTSKLSQSVTTTDGKDEVLTMDNYKQIEVVSPGAKWTKEFVEKDETGEVKAYVEWQAELYKSMTEQQIRDLGFFWKTGHHELYNANDKTLKIEFWESGKTYDFSL